MKQKLLFICNANFHRSPTAAEVFKDKYKTKSAGVGFIANQPLTEELIKWADIIFVMEDWQRKTMAEKFPKQYLKKMIINLDIPDIYNYMNEKLVTILKKKIKQFYTKN